MYVRLGHFRNIDLEKKYEYQNTSVSRCAPFAELLILGKVRVGLLKLLDNYICHEELLL